MTDGPNDATALNASQTSWKVQGPPLSITTVDSLSKKKEKKSNLLALLTTDTIGHCLPDCVWVEYKHENWVIFINLS